MAGPVEVGVAVIAEPDDEHARAVLDVLETLGASAIRVNLADLPTLPQVARPGSFDLLVADSWHRVSASTTVWWHRSGTVDVSGFDEDEARLVLDEARHQLRGALAGAGVRWVDDPFDVERAETKLIQLAAAANAGFSIPLGCQTNVPEEGRRLGSDGRVIAKAVSPGVGIAPFVDQIEPADFERLSTSATLVQRLVTATADLRVVIIGGNSWAWRRSRSPGTIDWRAEDPSGTAFERVEHPEVCRAARQMTAALRLTMSVQDWLETSDGLVFLEVNPQGRWLFLPGALDLVAPALGRHLLQPLPSPTVIGGVWPRPLKRFRQDFRRASTSPENDGVVAPTLLEPSWINEVAPDQNALDTARRSHEQALSRAQAAEEKASRLVQVALALLTLATAVGAYQLGFVLDRSWPMVLTLAPVSLAVCCLSLAAFEGVEIDRVGVYRQPTVADLVRVAPGDPGAVLIVREEQGRALAAWTSDKKHTALMQARAWFSRGLAALIVAGLAAAACRAVETSGNTGRDSVPASRTGQAR